MFLANEKQFYTQAQGTGGACALVVNYTNGVADTGGVIKPGANAINVAGSRGLRKIYYAIPATSTAAGSEPQVVVSFDSVHGGDVVTITTAADQDGTVFIFGECNGQ